MHQNEPSSVRSQTILYRLVKYVCLAVVLVSVLSCIGIAIVRSEGLTNIRVTCLSEEPEPRDHKIPLVKQKESLPDYQVIVCLTNGQRVDLGTKPNTSAAAGLEWVVNQPIALGEITSVRLQEQDVLISDPISEVQITGEVVTSNNYRFNFASERSIAVGLHSFFQTPIGLAITGAFFVAILVLVLASFA